MEAAQKKKADKKVVILGDSGVGKTCLIRRYIDGDFSENAPSTIGAAFFLKQWQNKNIALWDTAGQEEYYGLTSFYCRNANAVILCYDICNRQTYDALMDQHSRLLESVADSCVMVLVGTKFDVINKKIDGKQYSRQITVDEAMNKSLEYTQQFGSLKHPKGILPIFETSSKTDVNVSDVFEYIFEILVPVTESYSVKRKSSPSGLISFDPQHESRQERTKKCC